MTYLLAGLAIAATDVPAQQEILAASPNAGSLYAPRDAQALAKGLKFWLNHPAALQTPKTAARRFCWGQEKSKLIHGIDMLFRS